MFLHPMEIVSAFYVLCIYSNALHTIIFHGSKLYKWSPVAELVKGQTAQYLFNPETFGVVLLTETVLTRMLSIKTKQIYIKSDLAASKEAFRSGFILFVYTQIQAYKQSYFFLHSYFFVLFLLFSYFFKKFLLYLLFCCQMQKKMIGLRKS